MITKFKKFENFEPKVGDYIIVNLDLDDDDDGGVNFISNNIGQITKIGYFEEGPKSMLNPGSNDIKFDYVVKYDNIPKKFKGYFDLYSSADRLGVDKNEILFYSKDKGDVETFLISKKYNL